MVSILGTHNALTHNDVLKLCIMNLSCPVVLNIYIDYIYWSCGSGELNFLFLNFLFQNINGVLLKFIILTTTL